MGPFFTETVRNSPDRQGSCWASIVQPLLDWGARKAASRAQPCPVCRTVGRFSQAYLQAIEDVENTLYQERKQREFLDRLERRRQFLERTVEETRDRYTNGLTDFLPVLDAHQGAAADRAHHRAAGASAAWISHPAPPRTGWTS